MRIKSIIKALNTMFAHAQRTPMRTHKTHARTHARTHAHCYLLYHRVVERTTVVSNGRSLRSSAMFLVLVAFWTTIVTNSPAGCSLLGRARWQTSSANQWNV